MTSSRSTKISIATPKGSRKLSGAQRRFNKLIRQIGQERQRLEQWEAATLQYGQLYGAELEPMLELLDQRRIELVFLLEKAYPDKKLGKKERARLAEILAEMTDDLVDQSDDPELKRLYNKYNDADFDAETEQIDQEMRAMMPELFAGEVDGDTELASLDEVMKRLASMFDEQPEREAKHRPRKKSAKALAREASRERAAQEVSQSIREVYRKLASALHPDREQDSAERARKTALMQRVNVAYAQRNLLDLLQLQLEVEQIDQSMVDGISGARLTHYNQVLDEQLRELRQEISEVLFSFEMEFGLSLDDFGSPADVMRGIREDLVFLRQDIDDLERQLLEFQDVKKLKHWLKTYRVKPNWYDDDEPSGSFDDEFDWRF